MCCNAQGALVCFTSKASEHFDEIRLSWFFEESAIDYIRLVFPVSRSTDANSIGFAPLNTWLPYRWETDGVLVLAEVK